MQSMRRYVASAGIAIAVTLGLALASPTAPAPARASSGALAASPAPGDGVSARVASRGELERAVIKLTNEERVERGKRALKANKAIRRAARKHSNKMADKEILDHQFPGEPSLGQRLDNAGYDWAVCAENIASDTFRTARSVVNAWMSSTSHRRNMLSREFRDIGVGVAFDDDGHPWWTMDLGKKR